MALTPTLLADLLEKLELDNDHSAVLKELRTAIITLSPGSEQLSKLVRRTSFRRIFDCLNTTDREQIRVACDVLTRILAYCDYDIVIHYYNKEFFKGAFHPDPEVKQMVLKQVKTLVAKESTLLEMSDCHKFIPMIMELIADPDLGVAKLASEVVVGMAQNKVGLALLTIEPYTTVISNLMKMGDIIRFRVHELTIELCKISPITLILCIEIGTLPALLKELKQDDVVLQLNCLELLGEVASRDYGVDFLEAKGAVREAEVMLNRVDTDPLASFLIPGLIKFFGNMGYFQPKEVIQKYPIFVDCLFKSLESPDLSLLGVVVDTVGILGSTVEGKMVLEKLGERMNNCMKQLGALIADSTPDMRVKAMNAVESLVNLKVEDQTTELLSLTQSWFCQLSSTPMDLIMRICKQPFSDLHGAALGIICALARQPWGQQKMKNFPGFFEYILDRSTTFDKEGKELKYEIVKLLVLSPTAEQIFGNDSMSKLKEYYKEGPFYVPALTEVAVEGAS